ELVLILLREPVFFAALCQLIDAGACCHRLTSLRSTLARMPRAPCGRVSLRTSPRNSDEPKSMSRDVAINCRQVVRDIIMVGSAEPWFPKPGRLTAACVSPIRAASLRRCSVQSLARTGATRLRLDRCRIVPCSQEPAHRDIPSRKAGLPQMD